MAASWGRPCPAVGGAAAGGAGCPSIGIPTSSIAAHPTILVTVRILFLVDSAAGPAYLSPAIRGGGGEGSENNLECGRIATVESLVALRVEWPAVRKSRPPLPPYQNRIILQTNGLDSGLIAGSWKQRSYGDGSCKISKTKGLPESERVVSLLFRERCA